ncbi:MAG: DUF3786 domain-containing protein [Candidatus Omnitrophota bacterium]|jgi:hypothetical protein
MGYEAAIGNAWDESAKLKTDEKFSVKFLADEYTIDIAKKQVLSLACNVPAKDFTAILLLHYYLARKTRGLPEVTGEWLTFRELSGIEGYEPAFRKRAIEPIIRKYGSHPEGILEALERLPGKRAGQGDIGIILEAFAGVPVLISLWRADAEFGPEANVFFDKSITAIFCTEDIVVLAGIIASQV